MKVQLFFFLFLLSSCTMHRYSINDRDISFNKIPSVAKRIEVELHQNKYDPEDNSGTTPEDFYSYNSDKLKFHISESSCIYIVKKSNYTMNYHTNVQNRTLYPLTIFLFLGSMGIFPMFEESLARISITIENKHSQTKKTYQYTIRDNFFTSWIAIPIYFIFSSESNQLSVFSGTSYPQKIVINQLDSELYLELSDPNKFTESIEKPKLSPKITILPIEYKSEKHKKIAKSLRDKLETIMVNKKYIVVERIKVNQILEEMKLSQTGLTESNQIKLGKLLNSSNLILGEIFDINENDSLIEFSVKNIDIESGRILWKYDYTLQEDNIIRSIKESISDLESKLEQ